MSNPIDFEPRGPAFVIRFNRPESRSPLSVDVLSALESCLARLEGAEPTTSVVFTGKDDVFASGADLREISKLTPATAREFAERGQNLMNRIAALEGATIAAINGFCFGGALDLALACDLRIASPNASFAHPGVGLGIITGWGGTQRLPRLIGTSRALELFLTAKRINAEEALGWGFVDKIVSDPLEAALNEYSKPAVGRDR